jgi:hypothetical protein
MPVFQMPKDIWKTTKTILKGKKKVRGLTSNFKNYYKVTEIKLCIIGKRIDKEKGGTEQKTQK